MREYSQKITLTENGRGIWTIDPIMGCKSGVELDKKGCYGDCYAVRSARIYGYDFSKNVLRDFESEKHLEQIKRKINRLKFPFIRMGNSGDPSENWEHTIKILEQLKGIDKEIVIITKHWNRLSLPQMERIKLLNVCINTSISAIDDNLNEKIEIYEELKKYCNSVLRCVSFDFNLDNKKGLFYENIQKGLFSNYKILDTIYRCSKSNKLYKDGLINIKEVKFLGKKCFVSKYNDKTYFGKCLGCLDKCGIKEIK